MKVLMDVMTLKALSLSTNLTCYKIEFIVIIACNNNIIIIYFSNLFSILNWFMVVGVSANKLQSSG